MGEGWGTLFCTPSILEWTRQLQAEGLSHSMEAWFYPEK